PLRRIGPKDIDSTPVFPRYYSPGLPKSRGFHIHKSHITDPQRLSRLLIAACLAYIWVVYLGSLCEKEGWREDIHRKKRCDLSLFQLGLRILEHFLNEELPIPVQFHVTI